MIYVIAYEILVLFDNFSCYIDSFNNLEFSFSNSFKKSCEVIKREENAIFCSFDGIFYCISIGSSLILERSLTFCYHKRLRCLKLRKMLFWFALRDLRNSFVEFCSLF